MSFWDYFKGLSSFRAFLLITAGTVLWFLFGENDALTRWFLGGMNALIWAIKYGAERFDWVRLYDRGKLLTLWKQ